MDQIKANPEGNLYRLAVSRLISKLCKDQSVKLSLDQRRQEGRRLEDETDKDVVCTANILPRKILKLFGN
jgi:hypothetical protein